MPELKDFKISQPQGLKYIIPLLLRKKKDESEIAYRDEVLRLKKRELDQESQERAYDLYNEINKTKVKILTDLVKSAEKTGDEKSMQTLAPQLESLTGLSLPKEQTPPPSVYGSMGSGQTLNSLVEQGSDVRYLVNPPELTGEAKNLQSILGRIPSLKEYTDIKGGAGTSLKKLINERDLLPPDDPKRKLYDQKISKEVTSKGMVIESDGKGGFTIRTNAGPESLQKATKTKVEEKAINANEGLARISNIVKSFKPEFQEIPTKMGVAWDQLKSKFGSDLPEDRKERLKEFGRYKQDALENINLYIKEITGAQMSEKEADRIRRAQPDPGDGIFGGDDPVTFRSKLVNQYKKLRMSNIRYNYYLKQGVDENTLKNLIKNDNIISFERMEKILDEKGEEYSKQLRQQNPDISAVDLFKQVKLRLSQELGIGD